MTLARYPKRHLLQRNGLDFRMAHQRQAFTIIINLCKNTSFGYQKMEKPTESESILVEGR